MYAVCVCVEGGGGWRVMCVHEFEEVVPSVLHIFWGGGKGGGSQTALYHTIFDGGNLRQTTECPCD